MYLKHYKIIAVVDSNGHFPKKDAIFRSTTSVCVRLGEPICVQHAKNLYIDMSNTCKNYFQYNSNRVY